MAFTIHVLNQEKYITSETPVTGHNVLADLELNDKGRVIAWHVNNYIRPLGWVIDEDATVEFISTTSAEGLRIYQRSLDFLLVLTCEKVLNRKAILRHSIGEGHYWEFEEGPVNQSDVYKLHAAMSELVQQDLPITRKLLPIDKAKRIFEEQGEPEIADLFVRANIDPVEVYRCGSRFGYFCGTMAPSTGLLKTFDLVLFDRGMVLQFPTRETPDGIPPFQAEPSLANVFFDYAHWLDVLNLNYLPSLHRRVTEGRVHELVLIAEAFHSQRLGSIAEEITSKPVKVVTIAGPSASGKTTFSERLKIQLTVFGKNPVTLPLDNFFLEREQSPRDENGQYDYERLDALDLDLLNDNLTRILAGEEVVTPRYNFLTGSKEPGKVIRLGPSDILVMEGIHGLNDRILSMVPQESRYGVFVSPVTGICMDPHNRTTTSDNRLLRRIVRDYRTRGKSAQLTLEVYPKVMRGALRYIFPYQNRADAIFNSALPYELGVLKSYVEPLLYTIDEQSPVFCEALRLLNILRFVPSIRHDDIPNNSVIREFIGGSCLDV